MAQVSLSGLASSLDTASIIGQLVSVQRSQQTLLKNQQAGAQKAADAYKAMAAALKSLGTQATDLAATKNWQGTTAASSAASVTVSASGTRAVALAFDVTSVAAAHSLVTADTVGALGATAASGPLLLTHSDGTTASIAVGGGSLTEVVDAINAAGEGLVANAVQTSPGAYRLQVSATGTGAASSFTLDGLDGFSGVNVLRAGSDATVHVGTDPSTAFDVTSTTNSFADVVPGLSFTVSRVETGVTVSSTVDGSKVADSVGKLVDAANALLADVAAKTAYDSATKTAGPLTGDSSARSLTQSILALAGGGGAKGISLTREGRLSFDRPAFLTAFAAAPDVVARGYGATTTVTAGTGVTDVPTLVRAGAGVRAGTYALGVSTASAHESWRADPPGGAPGTHTFGVARGSTSVSYASPAGESLADAATNLTARLAAAGLGVSAAVSGSGLVLTADAAGTAGAFAASVDGVAGPQVRAGRDVVGTIDGQAATGSGAVLTLRGGTGGAVGLSVSVPVDDAQVTASGGAVGTIAYRPGFASRLATLVDDATASTTGLLATAQQGRLDAVKDYQHQIDRWDRRLTAYRELLTRQFTAMETAIATLKSQTGFLAGLSTGGGSGAGSSSSG